MDRALKAADLVDAVMAHLEEYTFTERARVGAEALRGRLAARAYDALTVAQMCDRVNEDLAAAVGDRHLRLIWHDEPMQPPDASDESGAVAELRETFRVENQGIRRVERLAGNIGLIELTLIPPAATSGAAIAAAMTLVSNTEALLLDLRDTRGGAPDGVALWCSFLLADGDTHLSDIIEGNAAPRQYWTSAYLPSPRYLDRPIWVLTSRSTFSGGEGLAYDLQALGRVTVVGEVTRGGAHPVEVVQLTPHVELRVPVARTVNPITGGDWEGVGVQPDIATSAGDAFAVAFGAASDYVPAVRHTDGGEGNGTSRRIR